MKPDTEILEERDDLLIIRNRDGVSTIPRSDYYILRVKHYKGNRIFYDFGAEGSVVKETYNEGVFNAWHDGNQVQIADADGIASAILHGDVESYSELFMRWYSQSMQEKVIDMLVSQYPTRISKTKRGYEVDGVFLVDKHGVSHCMDCGKWKHLCLVACNSSANGKNFSVDGGNNKRVTVNDVTITIMAKIGFLLCPNMSDGVFTSQLTEECRNHLARTKRTDV